MAFFRVAHDDLEHEAVNLSFRQLIGALALYRILSGKHHERGRKGEGLPLDADLPFLHRLQESGLDFGGSPVDLICEDEVREDRPFLGLEARVLVVVDLRASDVRRQ